MANFEQVLIQGQYRTEVKDSLSTMNRWEEFSWQAFAK